MLPEETDSAAAAVARFDAEKSRLLKGGFAIEPAAAVRLDRRIHMDTMPRCSRSV